MRPSYYLSAPRLDPTVATAQRSRLEEPRDPMIATRVDRSCDVSGRSGSASEPQDRGQPRATELGQDARAWVSRLKTGRDPRYGPLDATAPRHGRQGSVAGREAAARFRGWFGQSPQRREGRHMTPRDGREWRMSRRQAMGMLTAGAGAGLGALTPSGRIGAKEAAAGSVAPRAQGAEQAAAAVAFPEGALVRTVVADVDPQAARRRRHPVPRAPVVPVQQPPARASKAGHAGAGGADERRDGRSAGRGAADGGLRRRELHRRLVDRAAHAAAAREPDRDGHPLGRSRRRRRQLLPATALPGRDPRAVRGRDRRPAGGAGEARAVGRAGRGRHLVSGDARRRAAHAARREPDAPSYGPADLHPRAARELPVVCPRAARHLRIAGRRPGPPLHRAPLDHRARARPGLDDAPRDRGPRARSSASTRSAT